MWMDNPHIISDSEIKLHLTYDYNSGNSGGTLIVHRKFNGNSWSELDTISTGWLGARHSHLVIDNNDKLYCFWYHGFQGGTAFYRILDNEQWGELLMVYDNNDSYSVAKAIVDSENIIHCSGYRHFEGQTVFDQKIVYSTYENQIWSDLIEISQEYLPWAGNDIALDKDMYPHIVWRQSVSNSIPANDGTLYSKFDGTSWTYPEIIVEDPSDQAIAIDKNNMVHIVDNEKYEDGYRLVHYQFINSEWVGKIIDEDNYGNYINKLINRDRYIYLINVKADTIIGYYPESSILFRKYKILTNTDEYIVPAFNSYSIYPNPSSGKTTISYILKEAKHTVIKIYNLEGKLLEIVLNEKQAPGVYKVVWDGTDKKGKEVVSGLYLIRLQAGRQIMPRAVEIIK
jgi:hypothetical protein